MRVRRLWALPLVPVYGAVVWVKAWMYGQGWLHARRLAWPVVSVGSLSAGGAGKTPVAIALAELLQARGWKVDVLSRGYGRTGAGVQRVDPAAQTPAVQFGDEPVLIAQRTGAEVWVAADRYLAGVAAEAAAEDGRGGRVHLLDDGFQHRRLARDLEVVVVTAEDVQDALLPAGNLRESLRALRRADFVVVREEELAAVESQAHSWMREDAVLWTIRRRLRLAQPLPALERCVVFSAIARPQNFVRMLQCAGMTALEIVDFKDHHAYTQCDVDRLIGVLRKSASHGFVTTEKDAVKLTPAMRAQLLAAAPLVVALLDVEFVDEAAVVQALEARLPCGS